MAETTETSMTVYNFDLFPQYDVAEDRKCRKDSGHSRLSIDDKKRDMIYFETVGEVSDACSTLISVGYDHNLMATVDELGR